MKNILRMPVILEWNVIKKATFNKFDIYDVLSLEMIHTRVFYAVHFVPYNYD